MLCRALRVSVPWPHRNYSTVQLQGTRARHMHCGFPQTDFYTGILLPWDIRVLGSSILLTQSSSLFLQGVSRCPWQHFSWQRFSSAVQEQLIVLFVLNQYWEILLFLWIYLFLALGMTWIEQRKRFFSLKLTSVYQSFSMLIETGEVVYWCISNIACRRWFRNWTKIIN